MRYYKKYTYYPRSIYYLKQNAKLLSYQLSQLVSNCTMYVIESVFRSTFSAYPKLINNKKRIYIVIFIIHET